MQVEVLSLGGSILVQDAINLSFLKQFRALLHSFSDRKFVVVVGGGKVARTYIQGLAHTSMHVQGLVGIQVTRLNAWLLSQYFGYDSAHRIPHTMQEVKHLLKKNRIVFCGGLRFQEEQTSDGTAASLAHLFRTRFINITNVSGLYTRNPQVYKDARLISHISSADFSAKVKQLKYHPGQHFVLDHHAAEIIQRHRIPTYIVGPKISNLRNLLRGNAFMGTTIG